MAQSLAVKCSFGLHVVHQTERQKFDKFNESGILAKDITLKKKRVKRFDQAT